MEILKNLDIAIKRTFKNHYTALNYKDIENSESVSEFEEQCHSDDKILVNLEDLSASYVYNQDLLKSRIIKEWLDSDISVETIDQKHNVKIPLADASESVYVLSSYSDAPEVGEAFFYAFAFIYKGYVYTVDINALELVDKKVVVSTTLYRSTSNLPVSPESIDGKGVYYMYRTSGISLRINDKEAWDSIPTHMRHGMAKNWSVKERLFLLMESV